MNFEKLQIVRDTIATKPEHFNMQHYLYLTEDSLLESRPLPATAGEYINTCGTCACIAGFTVAIFAPQNIDFCTADTARNILEITIYEADYLFTGRWSPKFLEEISISETLEYLDEVIRTKDLFWNKNILKGPNKRRRRVPSSNRL